LQIRLARFDSGTRLQESSPGSDRGCFVFADARRGAIAL
jgi:hypothetical protein